MLKRLIFAAIFAFALAQPALAERGDPEEGRILAYTCTGCHGIPFHQNVYPTYSVPRIGGQTYGYIVSSLKAYRSGERKHPTMEAQANTLSDQDIHDVAAFFVSLTEDNQ
jgi:cytochrome c553